MHVCNVKFQEGKGEAAHQVSGTSRAEFQRRDPAQSCKCNLIGSIQTENSSRMALFACRSVDHLKVH